MTATFDASLGSLTDHIRLALGDTDTDAPLLQDETIAAKLAALPYCEALAQLADGLATEFAQRPDQYEESGGVQITWSERVTAWQKLAADARAGKIVPPTTSRISRPRIALQETDKQAQLTSTTRTDPTVPTLMEGFRAD